MRLKKIKLTDFRCFKDYSLDFAPGVTVLIGRNGAGKTSLIHAVHDALSFVFTNDKSIGENYLSAGNPDLKVASIDISDFRKDKETRKVADSLEINAVAQWDDVKLDWSMYKRSTANASLFSSRYSVAYKNFIAHCDATGQLPLLAYYSDSFPHKPTKLTKFAIDSVNAQPVMRNFGYYQWDEETACTSVWENRFLSLLNLLSSQVTINFDATKQENALDNVLDKRLKEYREEGAYVLSKMKAFSERISTNTSYQIESLYPEKSEKSQELAILFKDGHRSTFSELPSGYKRLFSMVFDMAYRSYILNGNVDPAGIVVIDEIDLHLHPSIEQCVVECLQSVFQKIQFIISTHSPLIISSLNTVMLEGNEKKNLVYYIESGDVEGEKAPSAYGLDYNSSLSDVMGTDARVESIANLINSYIMYKKSGLNKKADEVYAKLKATVGDAMGLIDKEMEKRL